MNFSLCHYVQTGSYTFFCRGSLPGAEAGDAENNLLLTSSAKGMNTSNFEDGCLLGCCAV
jgi:hypothetical protein